MFRQNLTCAWSHSEISVGLEEQGIRAMLELLKYKVSSVLILDRTYIIKFEANGHPYELRFTPDGDLLLKSFGMGQGFNAVVKNVNDALKAMADND